MNKRKLQQTPAFHSRIQQARPHRRIPNPKRPMAKKTPSPSKLAKILTSLGIFISLWALMKWHSSTPSAPLSVTPTPSIPSDAKYSKWITISKDDKKSVQKRDCFDVNCPTTSEFRTINWNEWETCDPTTNKQRRTCVDNIPSDCADISESTRDCPKPRYGQWGVDTSTLSYDTDWFTQTRSCESPNPEKDCTLELTSRKVKWNEWGPCDSESGKQRRSCNDDPNTCSNLAQSERECAQKLPQEELVPSRLWIGNLSPWEKGGMLAGFLGIVAGLIFIALKFFSKSSQDQTETRSTELEMLQSKVVSGRGQEGSVRGYSVRKSEADTPIGNKSERDVEIKSERTVEINPERTVEINPELTVESKSELIAENADVFQTLKTLGQLNNLEWCEDEKFVGHLKNKIKATFDRIIAQLDFDESNIDAFLTEAQQCLRNYSFCSTIRDQVKTNISKIQYLRNGSTDISEEEAQDQEIHDLDETEFNEIAKKINELAKH